LDQAKQLVDYCKEYHSFNDSQSLKEYPVLILGFLNRAAVSQGMRNWVAVPRISK
jgi:hypothetical protein